MDIMNLIPAPYQAPVMAGLAALVAITHAMAFFQPTSGIAGKIGAVLNALAGNYGKATNADAPATPKTTTRKPVKRAVKPAIRNATNSALEVAAP